jgi:hypothetical protein
MANGIIRLDDGWRLDEGHRFDLPPNVPPPASSPVLTPKPKGKAMDIIPPQRGARYSWLTNLSDNIIAEAVKMGVPTAEATAAKATADNLLAKMDATDAAEAALDGARSEENAARTADVASLRARIRNWKTLPGYATSGSEGVLKLRSVGEEFDSSSYKCEFDGTVEAGKVRLNFRKKGVDAVAIYARLRGASAFAKIGTDSSSPYYDTRPLAEAGAPEVREYMLRGLIDDEEIGLDSDAVSVSFAG